MQPTIVTQRAAEIAQGLVVRRRPQWGSVRSYTDERAITYPAGFVFVHITITNPDAYPSEDAHMRAIERIGISRFPNTGISYNMIVMPSGRIFEAQPLGRRGAHTVNDKNLRTCNTSGCPSRGTSLGSQNNLNYNARAIAIAQNVGDPVSDAMVDSIARTIATWKRCGFVARGARIHGHRCVANKDCPGSRCWARMGEIAALAEHYTKNGLGPQPEPEPEPEPVQEDEEMDLLIDKGSSVTILLHEQLAASLPRADGIKLRDQTEAQGRPIPHITGLSAEAVAVIQSTFIAQDAAEEPAEPSSPTTPTQ